MFEVRIRLCSELAILRRCSTTLASDPGNSRCFPSVVRTGQYFDHCRGDRMLRMHNVRKHRSYDAEMVRGALARRTSTFKRPPRNK